MSAEVMHTLEEDKQVIQKQLGCMNGIFQLFDRRYLLGQRRHGNHHKKPAQGQSITHNKFNNTASDKLKDPGPNTITKEKHRESLESSTNSLSSSTCSSLDCCKQVHSEHNLCVTPVDNIRDVVKDSMTRKPRAVSVKTIANSGRKGPTMTHVDSPRLLQDHPKTVTYERRDQNLVKVKETFVKDVKETSRYSYDDRVSPYKLQSYANIKDYPRLSLDSHKSSNVIDRSPMGQPGSNKPPPSSVVARLMGLDVINYEAQKNRPCLHNETILLSNALTRIPLEPAPWKQEAEKRANVKVNQRGDHACQSVYGHVEKRLTEVGSRTSGKDLKSLKHTLEAMQRTNFQKVNAGNGHGRNLTPTGAKATGRTMINSQRPKIRKQSNGHMSVSSSKTRDTRHIRNLSEESVDSQNEPDIDSRGWTRETKNKFAKRLMGYKAMAEQPSPVSVLDAFYTEDATSPIKKKSFAFKDDEDPSFDDQEWSQVDDLINTKLNKLTSGSNDIKFKNIKQHVHQPELHTIINPHEGTNEDQIYINEILSGSGFLKNLDFATTIVHLHPTGSLINPELFHILEKSKECTSKSKKIKRKLIFDTVNNILVQKLSRTGSHCPGHRTSKRKMKILDAKTLVEELCLEIHDLHTNKNSEDWDDYCNEVPSLVFDIERLVFKDLITEIMNAKISSPR